EYELFLPEDKHPFIEREEAEWELADVVLTGSDFVTEGLVSCGVEGGKCVRVPYGVNLETFSYRVREKRNDGKLRILFVGQVGLRKGIPYLLRALEMIGEKHIAVKIAGKICVSNKVIDRYRASHDFLGEVPRSEIPDLYSWADVFVIPSLCEGSATVTYEALASGVPVIATPNTGSLVRDGIDGQIVPIRDPEAIASAIEKYISEPKLLEEHRRAAQGDRWRCGLDAYRKRLL
ncbi:MAG: glycosyltransferase, partial [Candidatus Aminicenantes bacterium]|nr:glycosyltransferase [Candidatus Aminicenantes bacterium]NIQ71771.1 glycosyltransferase [Candidatus Aminicenantes bacterium]NIT27805.1 glycosyltransferase [Candidatus Aminicenantes bacterium]